MWSFWTKGKLDVLRRYLDAYTTATKSVSERIYLDAFAGELDNEERLTGEQIESSASIALLIGNPPFTRVRLFEREGKAKQLASSLHAQFPGRDLKVYGGDCNERIPEALAELKEVRWAPTFAFIDPNGTEAEWKSLVSLAGFREAHRTKTELFILFSAPMFTRLLPVDGNKVRPQDLARITAIFGCDDWQHIYAARLDNAITPGQARDEYLNLMRWRLEKELGYRWTQPLEVRNERGIMIYHMVFATDHDAGYRIMKSVYARAAAEFPSMAEQARRLRKKKEDEERGVQSLFGEDDALLHAPIQPGERLYIHDPPTRPWFMEEL
ncbi:three-Cys-motif partner protein TcmP [Candidatus Poriferisocius sp.]|uniref:three-Cys-motif partner protein TcmP n=1 Tax=Candidatus Poriferisocius sp. TaxID=3101276 RepID=UPI003B010D10